MSPDADIYALIRQRIERRMSLPPGSHWRGPTPRRVTMRAGCLCPSGLSDQAALAPGVAEPGSLSS